MSLRVLHVSEPTDGGVAVVALEMMSDQLRRGWDVALAAPEAGFLIRRGRELGAETRPWAATRRPDARLPAEVALLRRIVRAVGPDVVHLHSSKAGLAGRLALRGRCPTIFQPHGWAFRGSTGVGWTLRVRWERLAARWSVVLCVSVGERELAVSAGIRADYAVIPNGVDIIRFAYADAEARDDARAQLGLRPVPTALCVGRLSVEKNQGLLLDAWPEVRAQVPAAELVLVGDGPDADRLRSRNVAGVHFAGEVRDAVPWYAAADVVLLPSRVEAMPLTVLEGLAVGRPVVATDVDGAREVLGAADVGTIVPRDDAGALGTAAAARLADPARAAAEGRRGRELVEQRYSLTRWADAVAALVEGAHREGRQS